MKRFLCSLAAMAASLTLVGSALAADHDVSRSSRESVLPQLLSGFEDFRRDHILKEKELFAELSRGQHPDALVISCSDSRADPALILNRRPGDIFVVRSIAALVPAQSDAGEHDAVAAALEYAVKHLAVHDVIVIAHSSCGGMAGLMHPESIKNDPLVTGWVSLATPAVDKARKMTENAAGSVSAALCEQQAARLSLENLMSYAFVQKAVDAGALHLHALYYDMQKGELIVLQSVSKASKESSERTK